MTCSPTRSLAGDIEHMTGRTGNESARNVPPPTDRDLGEGKPVELDVEINYSGAAVA